MFGNEYRQVAVSVNPTDYFQSSTNHKKGKEGCPSSPAWVLRSSRQSVGFGGSIAIGLR